MLDDFAVGQKFTTGEHYITAEEIKSFARLYDPQPFHLDEQAARHTFFGELVASGWHTAAITMQLLVSSIPIDGGHIGAGGEITWPKSVKPGDTLQAEAEIMEVRPSKSRSDRGIVTVRTITRNQNGDAVQILTSKIVVPKRQ